LLEESDNHVLFDVIPVELRHLILAAAKQGTLMSCLLTLTSEAATDYLQSRHYGAGQIYWINQAIRTLALMAMGTSYGVSMATPLANFVLTSLGLDKERVSYLTTGASLAFSAATSATSWLGTSLAIATGVTTSVVVGFATKKAYSYIKNEIKENAKAKKSI
jgi:hypothetical protein